MKKFNKKAFIFSIAKLVIFVVVVILLCFLIKNKWDIGASFADMAKIIPYKNS